MVLIIEWINNVAKTHGGEPTREGNKHVNYV